MPPRHIVAVGGLVRERDGDRVLLIRSPRRGWEFPGGQVEEGESLTAALVREVREETGLSVLVGALVGVYTNTLSKLVILDFLCEWAGDGTLVERTSESVQAEWVSRQEALLRVTHPPLRDRLRDMIEFDGTVIYRSYEFGTPPGGKDTEYVVREERYL